MGNRTAGKSRKHVAQSQYFRNEIFKSLFTLYRHFLRASPQTCEPAFLGLWALVKSKSAANRFTTIHCRQQLRENAIQVQENDAFRARERRVRREMITTRATAQFEEPVQRKIVLLSVVSPQSCPENSPLVSPCRKLKVDFSGNIRRRHRKEVGKQFSLCAVMHLQRMDYQFYTDVSYFILYFKRKAMNQYIFLLYFMYLMSIDFGLVRNRHLQK